MLLTAQEHQLITGIYDAALEPSLWDKVMAQLVMMTDAKTATFFGMDALTPSYNFVFSHNVSPENVREYFEEGWADIDRRVIGGALEKVGVGIACCNVELFGSLDHLRQELGEYYLFLKRWGMLMQAGVLLEHSPFCWTAIGIHRPEDMGEFSAEVKQLLERVAPHLRRALQIHRQLSRVRQENTHLHQLLDVLTTSVLLLNRDGRLVYANQAAENILHHSSLLSVHNYRLQARDARQHHTLYQRIEQARMCREPHTVLSTESIAGCVALTHTDSVMTEKLFITIVPFSHLQPWQALASDEVAVALFLTDPTQAPLLQTQFLQAHYQLTPREVSICQCFVKTPNLEAIAADRHLSLETVRTYLKSIFTKTQCHSQAELLSLLMSLRVQFEHIR
ncbi:helix-turn-helix transcriptional regulator [Agitococcus lubricus]|uniref:PAS domain-containing protein n=1 Tax=Agitococcus lubricus TaxID=1077255 RepID=A0A2T5J2X3_9GAMM|nr:helix-turn-helix transcriptional regulator [Agitococcus lubricus]PTQ90960.1 PAS domain-containing protein [Agitococcus lubricus]